MVMKRPKHGPAWRRAWRAGVLMAALAFVAAAVEAQPPVVGQRLSLGGARLRPGVRVLDGAALEGLAYDPQAPSVLALRAGPKPLRGLSRGDVLVAGVSAHAPQGLLRRVTRVSSRGGALRVETAPATLEDVFWRARARGRVAIDARDIARAAPRVQGVRVPEAESVAWSPGRIDFELLDVVLWDLDGDPATTGDQLSARGSLGVEPTFDVDLDIAWGRIRKLEVTNRTRISTTLELDGRVTVADLRGSVTVASVEFTPVTLMVGPIPIVITPILDVEVGVSGSVTAGIRTSVTAGVPVAAGVVFENGAWRGFADLPDGIEDVDLSWQKPELSAEADVDLEGGPRLTLLLYGIGGPYASVFGYAALHAPLPSYTLDLGVRGEVGLAARTSPAGAITRQGVQAFDRRWRVAEGELFEGTLREPSR
jgi:hypothetical protein